MITRWQRHQRVTSEPASQPFMEYLDQLANGTDNKTDLGHTHLIADVVGLETALAGKAEAIHTHLASQVTDLPEAIDDRVAALLQAGANITLTYDDTLGTLTIAASGGGGSGTGGSAVLDFGAAPGSGIASVAITGQAGVSAASRIRAWVQGSTADHNEYEHTRIFPSRIGLAAGDVVAGDGFTIHAETELRLTGDVAVKWEFA